MSHRLIRALILLGWIMIGISATSISDPTNQLLLLGFAIGGGSLALIHLIIRWNDN